MYLKNVVGEQANHSIDLGQDFAGGFNASRLCFALSLACPCCSTKEISKGGTGFVDGTRVGERFHGHAK